MKDINTMCGQNAEFLSVIKAGGTYRDHCVCEGVMVGPHTNSLQQVHLYIHSRIRLHGVVFN
jgi:hypothetical protein